MFQRFILPFAMIAALTACDKKTSTDADRAQAGASDDASHAGAHSDDAQKDNTQKDEGYMPSMSGTPGPALDPGETRVLGEALPEDATALSLPALLDSCLDSDASCVVDTGVGASCTHSGCWFTLVSPDSDALVLVEIKDEAFTMPKNAAASDIVARGTLTTADFSKTQSHYFRSEAARQLKQDAPDKASAPTEGFLFTIDGAKITKSADAAPIDPDAADDHDHGAHEGHDHAGNDDHGHGDHKDHDHAKDAAHDHPNGDAHDHGDHNGHAH